MAIQSTSAPIAADPTTQAPSVTEFTEAPKTNAAPGGTRGHGAPNVMALFAGYGVSGNFGPQVTDYIAAITKTLTGTNSQFVIRQMPSPTMIGTHIVSLGDAAILLVFPKLQSQPRRIDAIAPYGEWLEIAKNEFKRAEPNLRLISGLVIMPEDLVKADQMAAHLRDALTQDQDPALRELSAASFGNTYEVAYVNDAEQARQLSALNFPQAVLPRADGGLVLRLRPAGSGRNQQRFGINSLVEQSAPVAWVTAYVDFVVTQSPNGMKYTPIVHLSSVQTRAQDANSMMFAIAAAVDWYLTKNGWVELVANYNPAARQPNIGNLLTNDDQSLFFARNFQELSAVIQANCAAPALVIDFVDGQARTPALSRFVDTSPNGIARLATMVAKFFNIQPNITAPNRLISVEFVGNVNINGVITDSRAVTYLDVVARSQAPVPDALGLLRIVPQQPSHRAGIIQQLNPTFEPVYQEQVIMPSPDFVAALVGAIGQSGFPLYSETTGSGFFSTSNYTQLGDVFSNLGALASGGYQGQSPMRFGFYNG